MCGITGYWQLEKNQWSDATANEAEAIVKKMSDQLQSRGPDSGAEWLDKKSGITMAHRRLSIIDLSDAGKQPMTSGNGQMVIVYNGEIYNYLEIRKELEGAGVTFTSNTDTEVILEACVKWGVQNAIRRFLGMFAFALWDRKTEKLYLARDRLGIKPLYWAHFDSLFMFASELKALRAHPGWSPCINRNSLAGFFRHNCIPAPNTIYENVYKLEPGCILEFESGKKPLSNKYWDLNEIIAGRKSQQNGLQESDVIEHTHELLRDAVGKRMIADVPLGAFLSGGIDSSLVVALMQEQSSMPVKTFSIGFDESGFDESVYAGSVAQHLGTDHTELRVSPDEAMSVIPELANIYDEPFSDSSQIPTYLVSKMTRQYVTVALSGDGGDECFSGYSRYLMADKIRRMQMMTPAVLRKALSGTISSINPARIDQLASYLPDSIRPSQAGHRLHKLSDVLNMEGDDYYRRLVSHWHEPEQIVSDSKELKGLIWDEQIKKQIPDLIERMRYFDQQTYLPDDILTKLDRASMAVSLEARVPLLDHRLIEYSWGLPDKYMMRNGEGKWPLRQILYKYVPEAMMKRPKAGFSIPLDSWLRGPLRDWAESLLDRKKLSESDFLNADPILEKWQAHLSGKENCQYLLWDVLMFQAWAERWG